MAKCNQLTSLPFKGLMFIVELQTYEPASNVNRNPSKLRY